MKRPAFQFYPADWRKDVELRSCSIAARGLWIDILCIAHDCEPYGFLMVNGRPLTAAKIAGQVGLTESQCRKLVDELISNGVARINAEGVIYSKRMVDDEELRNRRAEGGKAGSEFGQRGAEHGSKGGRPKKETGDKKTPLETPLGGEEKPPPSSSSSSSLLTSFGEDNLLPLVGGSGSALRTTPEPAPAPPFDGQNAEVLNGKSIVPLAAGWELPEPWGVDAEALGWKPADVLKEAEKFRQYWVSGRGAGQRRSVRGWRQSWSTWLDKAARDHR